MIAALRSVAQGIPEFGRGDVNGEGNLIHAGIELNGLRPVFYRRRVEIIVAVSDRYRSGLDAFDFKLRVQAGCFQGDLVLVDVEALNSQCVPGLEADWLPYAFRD